MTDREKVIKGLEMHTSGMCIVLNENGKEYCPLVEAANEIENIPSVPAVPMDKLCEWLAGNAWRLGCSGCDVEHCDCPRLYYDSGSSPEFWKTKLTKWMEENK